MGGDSGGESMLCDSLSSDFPMIKYLLLAQDMSLSRPVMSMSLLVL